MSHQTRLERLTGKPTACPAGAFGALWGANHPFLKFIGLAALFQENVIYLGKVCPKIPSIFLWVTCSISLGFKPAFFSALINLDRSLTS
jgi:hypothetical protein